MKGAVAGFFISILLISVSFYILFVYFLYRIGDQNLRQVF